MSSLFSSSELRFAASRDGALERLRAFVPRAGRAYAAQRNYDRGPDRHENVSQLSPYVRHRVVTEAEVLAAVLQRHGTNGAAKFVDEVFWRTYWKGWLQAHPAAWTRYRRQLDQRRAEMHCDDARRADYERAIAGATGIEPFDAWVRELTSGNYLHNHARMWFASVWIFTLRLPWELGADFFLQHLLDGDQAANTLSWRWVAGLHTRGKTYLARRDNIRRYTEERLDPGSRLAGSAPPLADDPMPTVPIALPPTRLAAGHRDLLLLHDDDVGIASFAADGVAPVAACAVLATDARSPGSVAPEVRAFTRALAGDALERAERERSIAAGEVLDGRDPMRAAAELQRVAAAFGCTRVVAPFAPVGPARDALDELRAQLARSDLAWSEVVRDYDAAAWPFATRGFFGLRARIPAIVRELGLDGSA